MSKDVDLSKPLEFADCFREDPWIPCELIGDNFIGDGGNKVIAIKYNFYNGVNNIAYLNLQKDLHLLRNKKVTHTAQVWMVVTKSPISKTIFTHVYKSIDDYEQSLRSYSGYILAHSGPHTIEAEEE